MIHPQRLATIATAALSLVLAAPSAPGSQQRPDEPAAPQRADVGYTLIAPLRSTDTVLIDGQGQVVQRWPSEVTPGHSAYLLDDGHLLRTGKVDDNPTFRGGGEGGRLQEIAPDGTLLWDYRYSSEDVLQHHDVEWLPNGNVLLIAWERRSAEEALAAGRDPALVRGHELWPDHVVEIEPVRPTGGKLVWEWHVWDHLVQDLDPTRANYGEVAAHPELVDINADRQRVRGSPAEESEELQRLRALGYVGGSAEEDERDPRDGLGADWNHTNSIDYHPERDEILLSVREFNEIWIIDHSTTTAEAAGHSGGRAGRGGDLLYRWGNPQLHGAGDADDQQLFGQHDAQWIEAGLPGAGHVLLFNNGSPDQDRAWSSVDELVLPVRDDGGYEFSAAAAPGPAQPVWTYAAPERGDFFSARLSGAQRLADGTTLVCSGENGRLFEVTPDGALVWEHLNELGGEGRGPGRGGRGRGGDGPGGRRPPRDGAGPEDGGTEGPGGPGGRGGPEGRGGPGGGPGGERGGRPGRGGPGAGPANSVFRAVRYPADHPGVQALGLGVSPGVGAAGEGARATPPVDATQPATGAGRDD